MGILDKNLATLTAVRNVFRGVVVESENIVVKKKLYRGCTKRDFKVSVKKRKGPSAVFFSD